MLQKQLQLATEIEQLQSRLAECYRERANLEQPTNTKPATAKALYDSAKQAWNGLGITVPAYTTLSPRLKRAATTMQELISNNPNLQGNLHVVLVPPSRQLDEAMLTKRYEFTAEYQLTKPVRRTTWGVIIVTSGEFAQPIIALEDDLGAQAFSQQNYDFRALGVREAIAADLLGLDVIASGENSWTVLLKDTTDVTSIPCVSRRHGRVIFDIDDAHCLLGDNRLHPAIAIR